MSKDILIKVMPSIYIPPLTILHLVIHNLIQTITQLCQSTMPMQLTASLNLIQIGSITKSLMAIQAITISQLCLEQDSLARLMQGMI
jgi:hypothetical protein